MALGVPQSSISPEPGARFNTAGAQGLASIQGDQASALGQAGSALGSTLGQIVVDRQNEANQLRVDDALNRLKEEQLRLTYDPQAGFTTQRGIAALERTSGQSLTAEYTGLLDTTVTGIAASLGNEPQRLAFSRAAADLRGQFQGQVTQHETREYTAYQLSVREGTIAVRTNEIATRWNDPTFDSIDPSSGGTDPSTGKAYPPSKTYREMAITSIAASVAETGRIQGWSATEIEAKTLKFTTAAHLGALKGAFEENNLGFAKAYYETYKDQIDGDGRITIEAQIGKEQTLLDARDAVERVMGGTGRRLAPGASDRAWALVAPPGAGRAAPPITAADAEARVTALFPGIVITGRGRTEKRNAEVGGAPNSYHLYNEAFDIRPIPGMKAKDFEARLRASGLPVAEFIDEGDHWHYAFGAPKGGSAERAKFEASFKELGGVQQAWAATVSSSAAVKAATAKAVAAGTPDAWLTFMPAEVQTKVASLQAAYDTGGGAENKPTLDAMLAEVRADPTLAGNPAALRAAEELLTSRWRTTVAAVDQRNDEAFATAIRYAETHPGTTWATLPASIREDLDPKDYTAIQSYLARDAKAEVRKSDPGVYAALVEPGALRNMTDAQFSRLLPLLSESDAKTFLKERSAQRGDPAVPPTAAITAALNSRLLSIGIQPSPGKESPAAQARVAVIQSYVRERVLQEQRVSGKQLTTAETTALIDQLFTTDVDFRDGLIGGDRRGRMLTMQVGDIPEASRKRLVAGYAVRGNNDPSDAELLTAYWRMVSTAARRAKTAGR